MKIRILLLIAFFSVFMAEAQEKEEINSVYRAEKEKVNDLVHTKLKVGFDYSKRQMHGEAWITLEPHFYNVSELELDAKKSERTKRRYKDLRKMGQRVKMQDIAEDLNKRDRSDMERSIAPLVKAQDAVCIDTTDLTVEEVVEKISKRCSTL